MKIWKYLRNTHYEGVSPSIDFWWWSLVISKSRSIQNIYAKMPTRSMHVPHMAKPLEALEVWNGPSSWPCMATVWHIYALGIGITYPAPLILNSYKLALAISYALRSSLWSFPLFVWIWRSLSMADWSQEVIILTSELCSFMSSSCNITLVYWSSGSNRTLRPRRVESMVFSPFIVPTSTCSYFVI